MGPHLLRWLQHSDVSWVLQDAAAGIVSCSQSVTESSLVRAPTQLKGMLLYHLKPTHGMSPLVSKGPGKETGFNWMTDGCQAISRSGAVLKSCPLHPLLHRGLGK